MRIEDIAEQSRVAEGRYYAASSANPRIRAAAREEAERWLRELELAAAHAASGAGPEPSGNPDWSDGLPDAGIESRIE